MLLAGPAAVSAADDGAISGTVVNGTEGGTAVDGVSVSLTVFDNMVVTADLATTVDANGNYEFTGLATDAAFSYRLETEFAGLPYESGFLQFAAGETVIPWDFNVYDSTPDSGVVSVVMAHVIMAAEEGYLGVTEYHVLLNGSDRAYVGAAVEGEAWREVLAFGLPPGASALDFTTGLTDVRMWPDGSGFSDGAPLAPGMREVVFTYLLPFSGAEKQLDLGFDYPIQALNLLVEDLGIEVTTTLTASDPLVMDTGRYLVFTGAGIPAGETINLTLKGARGAGGTPVWVWVLVALAVGGIGGFIWWRRRAGYEPADEDAAADSVSLLGELARLDDEFEAGEIPEADYQRQRADIKAELVSLMQRESGEDTP